MDQKRRTLLKMMSAGAALPMTAGLCGSWAIADPTKSGSASPSTQTLLKAWTSPERHARPGAYWYWLNSNVSREGITADLESMQQAGIGTVALFTIGETGQGTLLDKPAQTLTPYWWQLAEFAIQEAGRLGLEFLLNACDGWGTAGGPWITPELSMQHLVWIEQVIEGGNTFSEIIAQPKAMPGYYRDLRILAFPRPAEWDLDSAHLRPKVSGSLQVTDVNALLNPDNPKMTVDSEIGGTLIFSFDTPFLLRSLTVSIPHSDAEIYRGPQRAAHSLIVEASDDGSTFRHVGQLEFPKHGWQTTMERLTHALPETRARYYKLTYHPQALAAFREDMQMGADGRLQLANVVLSARPYIHHAQIKSGDTWGISRRTNALEVPDAACVRPEQVLDLTERLDKNGCLAWDAPPGRWTLLRIGYTSTGKENTQAGNGTGLECDRFSAQAARAQFNGWFGQALQRVGPTLAGKVLHVFHVDSWEAKSQNWSPVFAPEFAQRRGYDLLPLLPIVTGIPLSSAEFSERVLFDMRRTIAELVSDNFYGELKRQTEQHGCLFSSEVANPTFPVDGLDYGRSVDIPMGEFWLRSPNNYKPTDIREAVSAAHIYGRRIAGAEAFTELSIRWDETPWMLKALGDHHFAQGINRFYLHVNVHQPWLDRKPGLTLNGVGTFFGRNQTWWKPGKAWIDYLTRSQSLLQQGRPVTDIAVFIGEDIPARAILPEDLPIPLPAGFSYDSINRDALMRLASVDSHHGILVLPSGARYQALVLPASTRMTPELAERLADFSHQGLLIIGQRPSTAPGARDMHADDARVQNAAARMLAVSYAEAHDMGAILRRRGIHPDVELTPEITNSIEWIHRQGDGWDLYFFCNASDTSCTFVPRLRTTGSAEIWEADTGVRRPCVAREQSEGRMDVHLQLPPRGAVFVVVRAGLKTNAIAAIEGPDAGILMTGSATDPALLVQQPGKWIVRRASGSKQLINFDQKLPEIALDGPWTLSFDGFTRKWPTLISWDQCNDDKVRHFSGSASYQTEFNLPEQQLDPNLRWYIDLGDLAELAQVRVNGQPVGTLWKPPFVIMLGQQLRPGKNSIEVVVTNTWKNHLIGEAAKPSSARDVLVVPERHGERQVMPSPDAPLLRAGLFGPVRIRAAKHVELR